MELRDAMPALKNKCYFNYGGQGPLPIDSMNAIYSSWEKIQQLGPFTNDIWPYISKELNSTKNLISQICNVNPSQVALTENVTSGCVLPLWGLNLKKDERILIGDCEHPGVVAACKELAYRNQLEIDIFPLKKYRQGLNDQKNKDKLIIESLVDHLKENTKLVVISHVLWNTGQIIPIKQIAIKLSEHPLKPFLLVDAAQSFGQIPIEEAANFSDIYALTGHKWACGPEGLGALILSKRVLTNARPTIVGWKSLKKEGPIDLQSLNDYHTDARKYEIATSCVPLLSGLRNSLSLLLKESNCYKRISKIRELSKYLWVKLSEFDEIETVLEGPPPCGLVSFSLRKKESHQLLVKKLGEKKIWLRVLEDPCWLRACVHITSNKQELDQMNKELNNILSSGFI